MYNIYIALVLIYIMYIYCVTSELIVGGKRPESFFSSEGDDISDKTYTRVKRERKMEKEEIPLQLIYASRATTLLRRTCNKK